MYASIKAIESSSRDDDSLWLTYWLVFSLFKVRCAFRLSVLRLHLSHPSPPSLQIVEGSADFLLQYIPFYMLIKVRLQSQSIKRLCLASSRRTVFFKQYLTFSLFHSSSAGFLPGVVLLPQDTGREGDIRERDQAAHRAGLGH